MAKMPEAHENRKLRCGKCLSFEKCKSKYPDLHELTRACVKYSSSKTKLSKDNSVSPIKLVRRDPWFKKLRRHLKEGFSIDDDLSVEVQRIRATVSSLNIDHRFTHPNRDMVSLSKKLEETQGYRDRLTEISIAMYLLLNKKKGLYSLKTLARSKILEQHSEVLKSAKTSADRDALVHSILKELEDVITQCETINDIAEMAIKNLDQSYWAIRGIVGIGDKILERRNTDVNIKRK